LQNTAAKQFPHSKIPLTPTLSRRERECRIQVVPLTERLIIAEWLDVLPAARVHPGTTTIESEP
jgi:hypothetical protein